MTRLTFRPTLSRRLYRVAGDVAFGLVVAGLALAGVAWIFLGSGCGSAPPPPPSRTTLDDLMSCLRVPLDMEKDRQDAAQADGGAE